MKCQKCGKEIGNESKGCDCTNHSKSSAVKILKSAIAVALIAGVFCVAHIYTGDKSSEQEGNVVSEQSSLINHNKSDIDAAVNVNPVEDNLYFKELSDEECMMVWDDIKNRMADISQVFWEFDFWDSGYYKYIPAEGRYSLCKYGMTDSDIHINEIALNLITTIPAAHGNDEVITYVDEYRQSIVESNNNIESKNTHTAELVLEVLRNNENKKNWNISGTFWVKADNRIQCGQIDNYGYDSCYPVFGSNDYILSLNEYEDNYFIQRLLGYFDFESGTISPLKGTSERELISQLGYDAYEKFNLDVDALSFVYWSDCDIEWLSDSRFRFLFAPFPEICKKDCGLSFVYDINSNSASDVELIADDCIPCRYQY